MMAIQAPIAFLLVKFQGSGLADIVLDTDRLSGKWCQSGTSSAASFNVREHILWML